MRALGLVLGGGIELEKPIARGGMGEVWLAHAPDERRDLAVKVLLSGRARTDAFVQEFFDELALVASLRHPNIVPVRAFGTLPDEAAHLGLPPGSPWVAMPRARRSLRDAELDWDGLVPILSDVLDGLAHIHAHGIVHRDLKPANILLGGQTWLADFGLAVESVAQSDAVTGTPPFMAPEQIGGDPREEGPWTDLYAFAAMVWKLTTGRYVFPVRGRRLLIAHLKSEVGRYQPQIFVPEELEAWLRSLLAKDPGERPQSVAEARAAFPPLIMKNAELPVAPPLVCTGAELLTLRPPRFVGRERCRALLDRSLARLTNEGFRLALCGPPGVGKTRTLEWARVQGHAGYGHRVIVLDGAGDPAASLLRQYWRLDGLEADAMAERIRKLAPFADAHTRAGWSLLVAEREAIEPAYADALLAKALLSAPPLLVIVDHPSAVSRLKSLIGGGHGMGWLVACQRPQDLPDGFPHVRLGRLADSSIRRIVGSIVRADRLFVDQLCRRARGNPGMALQLLRRLFETGALQPTRTGFSVAEGTTLPAPASTIYASEATRLRRAVSPDAFRALVARAAAAELDADVVWEKICARLGIDTCPAEVRVLEQRGWVHRHQSGWRFSSDLLVDALLEEAIWDGTADAVHRAVLAHLDAERPHDLIERSRHSAAIQDWALTYDLAFQAVWACFFRGAYNVGPLLDRLDLASQMLGVPAKRSEALRARAVSDRLHGHPELAHRRLDEAEAIEGLPVDAVALLELERGQLDRSAERQDQARKRFERARELAISERIRAEADLSLGEIFLARGEPEAAHAAFQRTLSTPQARPIDHAYAAYFLAQAAQGAEAFESRVHEALRVAKSAGFLDVVTLVEMLRGDQALHAGDCSLASECFTRAYRQAETLGSELKIWCAISMALVGWKSRDMGTLQHWLAVVGPPPGPAVEVFVSLLGAFHFLVDGRDAPALREAERVATLVGEHGIVHPLLVELLEDARALAVGQPADGPLEAVGEMWNAR